MALLNPLGWYRLYGNVTLAKRVRLLLADSTSVWRFHKHPDPRTLLELISAASRKSRNSRLDLRPRLA